MPIARFQMPDGRVARFEVPNGTTPEQAQAMIAAELPKLGATDTPAEPLKIGKDAFPDTLRQVLRDADWGTRNIAGAGTALTNLWEGVKQFAGKGDQQNIANQAIIRDEAPIGAFAGDVALTAAPFALAGNSLKAAGAVGAAYGATQPVQGEQTFSNVATGKAINTALGGGLAAGGQAVANKAGQMIGNKVANLAQQKAQNAPLDATIKEALDAGYTIPPGNINPSFLNRQLESAGGKIATQQMAATKNQTVTDALARKAAGLGPADPITPTTLKTVRDKLGAVYEDVGKVVGKDMVEKLKILRADANDLWNMQGRNPHPETLALAKKATEQAKNLEATIDQVLIATKNKGISAAFKDARRKIAISHGIENALVEGGGTINAQTIARMAQRGDPLSGEMATIGNFANNFPKITQPDKAIGTPDAHNLKTMLALAMGGGGAATSGDPKYAALGVLPFLAGPAARSAMFSKAMQSGLLSDYTLGLAPRMTGGLLQYSPVGGAVLGLDALGQ